MCDVLVIFRTHIEIPDETCILYNIFIENLYSPIYIIEYKEESVSFTYVTIYSLIYIIAYQDDSLKVLLMLTYTLQYVLQCNKARV